MPSETEYKREFRKLVGVWSEAYETRSGGGLGYPDLQLLVGGILLPVELKTGTVRPGLIKPSAIRPSQISWHHDFRKAGGKAWVLVCVGPVNAMDAWALPDTDRETLSQSWYGYPLMDCTQWVRKGELIINLHKEAFQIATNGR